MPCADWFSAGARTDAQQQSTIGFLTDVEGNLDYFNRFVALSKVLYFADNVRMTARTITCSDSPSCTHTQGKGPLLLRDHAQLVFGGDCFDKGPGDLRVGALLIDLKRRYPDRVSLIMGMRVARGAVSSFYYCCVHRQSGYEQAEAVHGA